MRLDLDAIATGALIGIGIGVLICFIVIFGPIITGSSWIG